MLRAAHAGRERELRGRWRAESVLMAVTIGDAVPIRAQSRFPLIARRTVWLGCLHTWRWTRWA